MVPWCAQLCVMHMGGSTIEITTANKERAFWRSRSDSAPMFPSHWARRESCRGEAMAGERLELVVQQTHADEMKTYERLLGDALRGDPRYSSVKTAWKPLGALWIRLWEARHRSMTTIRTPGSRQRLTASLLMMAAGTIPSRSRTKRCKRQNEGRERGCDVAQLGCSQR
jgi:hypothetical protein